MSEVTRAEQLAERLMACSTVDFDGDFTAAAVELRRLSAVEARCVELEREVHNLNWALGTEGYPQMAAPGEQAEADAAHAATLARIEAMKTRKDRWDSLIPDGVDVLDYVARQSELLRQAKEAIELVRACIGDGAPSGFNPVEGDLAERLYRSQWSTKQCIAAINEWEKSK